MVVGLPCSQTDFTNLTQHSCPFPYAPDSNGGCTTTYASLCGVSYTIHTIYMMLLSLYSLFIFGYRLFVIRNDKKAFGAVGPAFLCGFLSSLASTIDSYDSMGYRGINPNPFHQWLFDCRTGLLYAISIQVLLMWYSILNARGAQVDIPPPLIVLRNIIFLLLFYANIVGPPLEVTLIPSGALPGLVNTRLYIVKVAVNGLLGGICASSSLYFGFGLVNSMKKGIKVGSTTAADQQKLAGIQRIYRNIIFTSIVLLCVFAYSAFLIATRIKFCWHYDTPPLPGSGNCGWNAAELCVILGIYAIMITVALPGQKSGASKIGEMVTSTFSRKGKSGKTTITSNNAIHTDVSAKSSVVSTVASTVDTNDI